MDQVYSKELNIFNLPDDLMVFILSMVSPEDLLRSVSLVCKRWNTLVKMRALWRRIDLTYDEDQAREFIEVVKRAPALRRLTLHIDTDDSDDENVGEVVRTLKEGVSDVSTLDVRKFAVQGDDDISDYLQILLKYKDGLEHLKLLINNIYSSYETIDDTEVCIFDILKDMKQLRSLEVETSAFDKVVYTRQLRQDGPALSSLSWDCSYDISFEATKSMDEVAYYESDDNPMLHDLIAKNKDSLTELKLKFGTSRLPRAIASVVAECHNLRSTDLPGMSMVVVQNMVYLQRLNLLFYVNISEESAMLLEDFIRASATMRNLTELIVESRITSYLKDIDPYSVRLNRLLDAIAKHCKTLRSVSLSGYGWADEFVTAIITQLPLLERLDLHECRDLKVHHLRDIASISHLRVVDIRSFKCHPMVKSFAMDAIEEIKSRNPGITLLSDGCDGKRADEDFSDDD